MSQTQRNTLIGGINCVLTTPCLAHSGRNEAIIFFVPVLAVIALAMVLIPLSIIEWRVFKEKLATLFLINAGATIGAITLYFASMWLMFNSPSTAVSDFFVFHYNIDFLLAIGWLFMLFIFIKTGWLLFFIKDSSKLGKMIKFNFITGALIAISIFMYLLYLTPRS